MSKSSRSPVILVIINNSACRRGIESAFKSHLECSVIVPGLGECAVDALKRVSPDLVFLEVPQDMEGGQIGFYGKLDEAPGRGAGTGWTGLFGK